METFHFGNEITTREVPDIIRSGKKLAVSAEALQKTARCRRYLEEKITRENRAFYGINTGFGALCNTVIPTSELEELQRNIVISHACGAGREVPAEVVKAMLILKIQNLVLGHSGVKTETVEMLCELYNRDILPVVYEMGSLGASGDLAPLAHLSLPLIGEGQVYHKGIKTGAAEALRAEGLKPLRLGAKEGLALLNGTQFMGAYGNLITAYASELYEKALAVAALSLEAYAGRPEAFDAEIHAVRPHAGQISAAETIRRWISDSRLIQETEGKDVQDPYSFRCIPQVMGASADVIRYAESVFDTENRSVSDNPLIFPDQDKIISGGNFHGQPLAVTLDSLCIAISEMGSLSERRIYRLLAGKRGLPPFLAENAGLHSGYMILQYATASIASRNKQLCTPASADSLESSNGQEDHVSMGANAAVKCYEVLQNTERIIAYELMTAARALEFRDKSKQSGPLARLSADFRKELPHRKEDSYMHEDMEKSLLFLRRMKPNHYLKS
jgi:histidine ammonia-lyase